MHNTYSITAMATQKCAISKILGLVVVRGIQMVPFSDKLPSSNNNINDNNNNNKNNNRTTTRTATAIT